MSHFIPTTEHIEKMKAGRKRWLVERAKLTAATKAERIRQAKLNPKVRVKKTLTPEHLKKMRDGRDAYWAERRRLKAEGKIASVIDAEHLAKLKRGRDKYYTSEKIERLEVKISNRNRRLALKYHEPMTRSCSVLYDSAIVDARVRDSLPRHTPKQYAFAIAYLKHGDVWRAYSEAGYADLSKTTALYRRVARIQAIIDSPSLQRLVRAIQNRVIAEQGLQIDELVEKLVVAHSHATTATEEISAIKEMGRLLGYYNGAERKKRVKKLKDKGLSNLSDFELKRLAAPDGAPTLELSACPVYEETE